MEQVYVPPPRQMRQCGLVSIAGFALCFVCTFVVPALAPLPGLAEKGYEAIFTLQSGLLLIPFSLYASWCGVVPGSVAVATSFIISSFLDLHLAYSLFNMYVVVQLSLVPVRFHWYRSLARTAFFVVFETVPKFSRVTS